MEETTRKIKKYDVGLDDGIKETDEEILHKLKKRHKIEKNGLASFLDGLKAAQTMVNSNYKLSILN